MIKANELRLKNYLQLDGEIYQVNEVYNNLQCVELIRPNPTNPKLNEYEECDLDYPGLNPVRLTKEILLSLGFENLNTALIKGEYILKQQSDFEWSVDIEPMDKFYHTIATIKSVHQLQNIYFALTGEELVFS